MVGLNGFCAMKKTTNYYRTSCVFLTLALFIRGTYNDNHLADKVKMLKLHSPLK